MIKRTQSIYMIIVYSLMIKGVFSRSQHFERSQNNPSLYMSSNYLIWSYLPVKVYLPMTQQDVKILVYHHEIYKIYHFHQPIQLKPLLQLVDAQCSLQMTNWMKFGFGSGQQWQTEWRMASLWNDTTCDNMRILESFLMYMTLFLKKKLKLKVNLKCLLRY